MLQLTEILSHPSFALWQIVSVGSLTVLIFVLWEKYRNAKKFEASSASTYNNAAVASATKTRDHSRRLPPPGPSWSEFGPEAQKGRLQERSLDWCDTYGNLSWLRSPLPTWILPHIVLVGDITVAKQLLVKESPTSSSGTGHQRRFISRNSQVQWATQQGEGRSLSGLASDDPEWKWRKTALLQQFHGKRFIELKLAEQIVQVGMDFVNQVLQPRVNQVIQADELTTQVAINVILYFLFGRRMQINVTQWRESALRMLEHVLYCFNHPLHWLLRYIPYSPWWHMEQRRNKAWQAVDLEVELELKALLNEFQTKEWTRLPKCALVSMLETTPQFRALAEESASNMSALTKSPSWEQLMADLRVMSLAGFETTAHGLSFSLGLLAQNPGIADQVAAQGRQVWDLLLSGDATSIHRALDQAPLAKYVFQEALRLYPVVPVLPGCILEDLPVTTSDGETYTLPQGANVLFLNNVLNRQTERGHDFDPYRWDTEKASSSTPFLNTFQTGPHVCPGKPMAMLEGHIVLLIVATRFAFEWTDQSSFEVCDHVMLKPLHGMPLRLRERT